MKYFFRACLFLFAVTVARGDSFDIDGMATEVPVPDGFVTVTPEMDVVHRLAARMADPMNDLLAYYIPESEQAAALAGEVPNLERTCMLKVNKQLKPVVLGSKDFAELKRVTAEENKKLLETVKSQLGGQMEKVSEGISSEFNIDVAFQVSNLIPLEPHYEATHAFGSSMYINYDQKAEGTETHTVVAATVTTVNAAGKALFLYTYGPEADLEWTRKVSQQWAESVLGANVEAPSKSDGLKSGGFDWKKVLKMAVIGAVAGGLFGALSALRKKKQQG